MHRILMIDDDEMILLEVPRKIHETDRTAKVIVLTRYGTEGSSQVALLLQIKIRTLP